MSDLYIGNLLMIEVAGLKKTEIAGQAASDDGRKGQRHALR